MTTSQTYQAYDDQLVHAQDQTISEDNPIEPQASLAAPEPDLAEPGADLATAEPDLAEPGADLATAEPDLAEPDADLAAAEPDLAEPDAGQTSHEDLTAQQSGAIAVADTEPATPIESGYPGFIADRDDRAPEPEIADSSSGSPSLVSVDFTVPESVADSGPAGNTTSAAGPWNEIQAMFVDDPRASIERAAGLVDDRVGELIQSVRDRQQSMQSAWEADDAGTEELRVALQHYRSFWNSLEDLPAQT
jgi:hypothetical protein